MDADVDWCASGVLVRLWRIRVKGLRKKKKKEIWQND
jgi:hypothetical protein